MNTRIIKVQTEMAERALELLSLPQDSQPKLLLDLGCGSGLSGKVCEAAGHYWLGMDISRDMLQVAKERLAEESDENSGSEMADSSDESGDEEGDEDGDNDDDDGEDDSEASSEESDDDAVHGDAQKCIDVLHHDMGRGACFRPGTFDGCISVSALQWLCHSNRSSEFPKSRLLRLFTTLFGSLCRGARAVFQFYPEASSQIDLILACAMKAGFTGGLVVDFPNSTRAKKYYLCLMTGTPTALPKGREIDDEEQKHVAIGRRQAFGARQKSVSKASKEWVIKKKTLSRKRGKTVKNDSKYTARKRKIRF